MPRQLVWTGFMTLDGVVDSPGGAVEGHPGGGWVLRTPFVPESFALKAEELEETSALMFGRRSYEAFAGTWPGSEDHLAYRDLPKYVVSASLGETYAFLRATHPEQVEERPISFPCSPLLPHSPLVATAILLATDSFLQSPHLA